MKYAVCALFVLSLTACNQDSLEGTYNDFEGKFDWFVSSSQPGPLNVGDPSKLVDANKTGYTAEIEINDKSHILFYRDGFLLTDNAFVIREKSSHAGGASLTLELKGSTGNLSLQNNELRLQLNQDTLSVDAYPFSSIDDESNYLNDDEAEINGNFFIRE
ncbi:MAG: hypothetical protein RLP15_07160 [Cryomorphaceae bacterium]